MKNYSAFRLACIVAIGFFMASSTAEAVPVGYVKTTIDVDAPPSGLAFAPDGTLYAFETPDFGTNSTVIRVVNPDFSFGTSLNVTSLDGSNFFLGGMTYDHVTDGLLLTDNGAGANALYSVNRTTGASSTIFGVGEANNVPSVAGVAVRPGSGEIFISTAPFADNAGEVLRVDRGTGATTSVVTGLDFGAGLAFDNSGNLLIEDADFSTFAGNVRLLTSAQVADNIASDTILSAGSLSLLASGLSAGAGITVDSEGDIFVTGSGGLFTLEGTPPLTETNFDNNGVAFQFSTAIAFLPGTNPFEAGQPLAGSGRLAFLSDFGFMQEDDFITLIRTNEVLVPEPGSLVLMFAGLSLVGIGVRRRRKSSAAQAARL